MAKQQFWEFSATSQMPHTNLNTSVRIDVNCGNQGFFDPRTSHFRFVVSCPSTDNVGLKYLDTCAENIIESCRWTRAGS